MVPSSSLSSISSSSSPPNSSIKYGTAGFRMNSDLLDDIVYKSGIFATILSSQNGNKCTGIMITASHNPVQDNGVKIIGTEGTVLTPLEEELVEKMINGTFEIPSRDSIPCGAKVIIGYDTRPSSPRLVECVKRGIALLGGKIIDLGLVTTPQLHYEVYKNNHNDPNLPSYLDSLLIPFKELIDSSFKDTLNSSCLSKGNLKRRLIVDASNGVGMYNLQRIENHISGLQVINKGDSILNHECGADYVKAQKKPPKSLPSMTRKESLKEEELKEKMEENVHYASFDGDADRLIYFYFKNDEFVLLDGDRISCLFALFVKEHLVKCDLWKKELTMGVVQTAYANGSSTRFLDSQDIPVIFACTGIKNIHRAAENNYDIGIYFEANGHGTILFNAKARKIIQGAKSKALALLSQLMNPVIGDALSDLLAVEAILFIKGWSMENWDSIYKELVSINKPVKIRDRNVIKTIDADRRVKEPAHLQSLIDQIVKECDKDKDARAFVRPSGTEDVVRIYSEAREEDTAAKIVEKITELLSNI